MAESAFKGTIKEGFERKFTVINERDFQRYIGSEMKKEVAPVFNDIFREIEIGRELDGKKPFNNYLVINLDEPYANEVIAIMKRHGHWG